MTDKQEIYTSEEPQQEIEMVTIDISTPTEEATERPIEELTENTGIKELAENVAEILSQVKISNRKDEIIDNLHKELMQYKVGLQETIIVPILKTVVREYDRANKQYRFYLKILREEPQSELFGKILSEFEMISFSLLNLLSDYGIEPFVFNVGDARDSKLQKIVEVIETEDTEQDATVADCVACGFRNIETARLLRQAEVKIFKLKNNVIQ
jgi:molecular chaperone GrpE (heat shock protein)